MPSIKSRHTALRAAKVRLMNFPSFDQYEMVSRRDVIQEWIWRSVFCVTFDEWKSFEFLPGDRQHLESRTSVG
jgi:hypothetical protein